MWLFVWGWGGHMSMCVVGLCGCIMSRGEGGRTMFCAVLVLAGGWVLVATCSVCVCGRIVLHLATYHVMGSNASHAQYMQHSAVAYCCMHSKQAYDSPDPKWD